MGSLKISQVEVKGVKEIFEKHENEESKGIKVHFKIDDNGILNIEKVILTSSFILHYDSNCDFSALCLD